MPSRPHDVEGYERFQLIINGPALFQSIVTAIDLGVFRFLAEAKTASLPEIEEYTGLAPHKARILLLALCTTGLVAKTDAGYAASPVCDEVLPPDAPDSWEDILLGWRRFQYPAFGQLTSALRTGTNTAIEAYPGSGGTLYERIAHDPETEKAYHKSLAPFTHLYVPPLLDHEELQSVRHLLDVGGGDGSTAALFAQRFPDARVTVFDFPSVSELAQSYAPAEVDHQITFHAGNFFTDSFPAGPDAVLFSHVLEPFSAEQNLQIMAKAFEILPAGGRLLAYGTAAPDGEDDGPLAARLSLFLNVLASGTGMAHPVRDYAQWMVEVGCTDVRSYPDLPYEHGLVVGVKS